MARLFMLRQICSSDTAAEYFKISVRVGNMASFKIRARLFLCVTEGHGAGIPQILNIVHWQVYRQYTDFLANLNVKNTKV